MYVIRTSHRFILKNPPGAKVAIANGAEIYYNEINR